ncbi:pathogenesis-related protein PRB1-3-like [Malus sylvestris]|uniref:pathogenesis-related protein PRB1-3-like n=1 Tax=Malus sylvestris TaxID=3752 RepID=UPI0021ABE328|nr:pathogenesis-related protein PRB1-3-like [Malus sylvestris]
MAVNDIYYSVLQNVCSLLLLKKDPERLLISLFIRLTSRGKEYQQFERTTTAMGSNVTILFTFLCISICLEATITRHHPILRAPTATPQEFLKVHNNVRWKIGLPPLQWDEKLAAVARVYTKTRATIDCRMVHSMGRYGENIFWGGGKQPWGARFAVNSWSHEKLFYDYKTNSCKPGQMCGHYTQMVWKDTKRLGCAREVCSNGAGELVICNYDPPGNWAGEKPY